ncbi:MAG: hypothetical protein ACRD3Q_01600 [Terriglobales bacterium]
MQINVEVDTSLLDKMSARYEKNLAYSVAQALNDTALEAQRRIRASLRQHFQVRKAAFLDRSIKIFAFANVGSNRPYAEIGVDNKQRLLLSLFEQGGQKTPFVGRDVAVPITGQAARPSIAESVRSDLTFSALHFKLGTTDERDFVAGAKRRRVLRQAGKQYAFWQGNQRTFILAHSAAAPLGGVFQRVGPKRDDIRLIYSFRQNVRLKAALDFVATTTTTFNDVFREAFFRRFYHLS